VLPRSLAFRERQALCDLALAEGPEAPTMRGTSVAALVTDLLRAERRRDRGRGFEADVALLRRPPRWWRPLDLLAIVVAHEDVRRARDPEISVARRLSERDDDTLWRHLKRVAPRLLRRHGVPVVLLRSDPPKTRWTAVRGDDPVVIKGKPLELVLAVHGRRRLYNVVFQGSRARQVRG
jgi:hypothetical protein